MRRILMLAAALAIPLSGLAVVGLSTEAGAAVTIVCTGFNGSVSSGMVQATGCTPASTGGSSQSLSIAVLASGGVVPWTQTPNNTTFATPKTKSAVGKKCPGYIKPTKTNKHPTEPSLVTFSGKVTADTGDGIKIPGKYSGAVCIGTDMDQTITAEKPLKIT
jgi:hypothetical protein